MSMPASRRRGPRAATGASDGPVEATVSGSHGGRRAERAEQNRKSLPPGKPVLKSSAGAISQPRPRPRRRAGKVAETNPAHTAAAPHAMPDRWGARQLLWPFRLVTIFTSHDRHTAHK